MGSGSHRAHGSVHPHARGEHRHWGGGWQAPSGSSPRTWGTPAAGQPDLFRPRFIPTHVGNTTIPASASRCCSVHPHARGEHCMGGCSGLRCVGSSPRTWGTRAHREQAPGQGRFIPTHVGNTATRRPRLPARWFIPTHVGNTTRRTAIQTAHAVHPHARGEHTAARGYYSLPAGSSPRTWGTLFSSDHVCLTLRFIPTHVGNTSAASPERAPSTVHPHARGEHSKTHITNAPEGGSSPRTWGTPAGAGRRLG